MEKTNTNIANCTNVSNMKKKIKSFLNDKNCADIRMSNFPSCLAMTLNVILDEIAINTLKYATKHPTNGLYTINTLMLMSALNEDNKFDFYSKYHRKYNSVVKYEDNLIFNISKVISNFELDNGNKLLFDSECKNYLAYLLMSLQYDMLELSIVILRASGIKTMTKQLMVNIINYLIHSDVANRICLKLDSLNEAKEESVDSEKISD